MRRLLRRVGRRVDQGVRCVVRMLWRNLDGWGYLLVRGWWEREFGFRMVRVRTAGETLVRYEAERRT